MYKFIEICVLIPQSGTELTILVWNVYSLWNRLSMKIVCTMITNETKQPEGAWLLGARNGWCTTKKESCMTSKYNTRY